MMTGTGIHEHWRPAMRNSLHRSPLLRSTVALGAAGILALLPALVETSLSDLQVFAIYGLAITAFMAGVLVLVQSTAIRRIKYLRTNSKKQLDELARAMLYSEQIGDALSEVFKLRVGSMTADAMPLIDRLLDSAATRASVVFDPSIRLYVVESTVSNHVVKARAGTEPFTIEVGKSCSANRSLDEVASALAPFWRIAPISVHGTRCSLVMLSDHFPSRADCSFVEQLALVISLADYRLGGKRQRRDRSQTRLRAV